MNQDQSLRSVVSDADTESRNEEASEEPDGIARENRSHAEPLPARVSSSQADPRHSHDDDDDDDDDDDSDGGAECDAASDTYEDDGNADRHNDGNREDNYDGASLPDSLPLPPQQPLQVHVPIPPPGNQFHVNYPYSPYPPPLPVPLQPPVHPPPPQHMLQFYEAQMRDHAAAYASAAAAAAWAAAQIAADMANAGQTTIQNPHIPRTLPVPPVPTPIMPEPYPTFYPSMGGPPGYPVMDPCPPYPPMMMMMDPLAYSGMQSQDGAYKANNYAHRRRKRQQRMPTSNAININNNYNNNNSTSSLDNTGRQARASQPHSQVDETRGRRRRFCQDGSSDNASDSNYSQPQMGNSLSRRRTRIRKVMASSNSSDGGSGGGGGGGAQFNKKKKPRQPNDDSLIGKTGVSALYEWCGKRRTTPIFSLVLSEMGEDSSASNLGDLDHSLRTEEEKRNRGDEFEMTVSIDNIEWGRGRARTKSAAKQEAARRALHALLPGVVFEEASGILIHLPNNPVGATSPQASAASAMSHADTAPWKASACLEDLAPNLAKRLAIGHAEDDAEQDPTPPPRQSANPAVTGNEYSKKRPSKWNGVYPCASTTTSEDDDENTYYASRGASVCSALLHAMVQIDDRIPEAPTYEYELATLPAPTGDEEEDYDTLFQSKRKADTGTSTSTTNPSRTLIQVHRGPFTCTATMRVRRRTSQPKEEESTNDFEILKAVGIGGAKREAKHTASAKLLALLFPECQGMAQVKQAAEAARERYAASKALKQQSKREWAFVSKIHRWHQSNEQTLNIAFALGSANHNPPLSSSTEEHFLRGLGLAVKSSDCESAPNLDESSMNARQWSRQKQFDEIIALALQKLNEHDEEGRSLPDQLTVDDVVGRTVLRRATCEDANWISKLLDEPPSPLSPIAVLCQQPSSSSSVGGEQVTSDVALPPIQMWASSTIVLLLCRAISPYDDPPLGCAVLTVGFSLEKGRTLRVAQIGSKPHLPRERFLECLQAFATCMNYSLETTTNSDSEVASSGKKSSMITIRQNEIQCILQSHLSTNAGRALAFPSPSRIPKKPKNYGNLLQEEPLAETALTLQAVQEESEGVEESGAESSPEKRVSKKNEDKPSKRSRVQ